MDAFCATPLVRELLARRGSRICEAPPSIYGVYLPMGISHDERDFLNVRGGGLSLEARPKRILAPAWFLAVNDDRT